MTARGYLSQQEETQKTRRKSATARGKQQKDTELKGEEKEDYSEKKTVLIIRHRSFGGNERIVVKLEWGLPITGLCVERVTGFKSGGKTVMHHVNGGVVPESEWKGVQLTL